LQSICASLALTLVFQQTFLHNQCRPFSSNLGKFFCSNLGTSSIPYTI
jgi:hypothetical protein